MTATAYPTDCEIKNFPGVEHDSAGAVRSYARSAASSATYVPTHSGFRESLFAEFQPLVKRLIRQYGDCPESRQELAGEIYFRFCTLLDAYDPERGVPLRPYMVRQLTASVYTFARQGWRRRGREVSLDMNAGACDSLHAFDPSDSWDDRLIMEQLAQELPEAIAKLPKRQRQVVIWRYYEERSFEEIAELLNIQLATARSLLRHGLNRLRRTAAHYNH